MEKQVIKQQKIFESLYSEEHIRKYDFHVSENPLKRYVRDRRLKMGLDCIKKKFQEESIKDWTVLVLCGGVGGEGIYFVNQCFPSVTVSDISENSLKICNTLEPRIKTIVLNGEDISLEDNSYDLVVVQDGLHHLPRPVAGFTEMLRVAKKAVIVIEPYQGVVGKAIGTEWEVHGEAVNYVFRWNRDMINQVVKSYLLKKVRVIKVLRFWDHNVIVEKVAKTFPSTIQVNVARFIYSFLKLFNRVGNMMVAVIIK